MPNFAPDLKSVQKSCSKSLTDNRGKLHIPPMNRFKLNEKVAVSLQITEWASKNGLTSYLTYLWLWWALLSSWQFLETLSSVENKKDCSEWKRKKNQSLLYVKKNCDWHTVTYLSFWESFWIAYNASIRDMICQSRW